MNIEPPHYFAAGSVAALGISALASLPAVAGLIGRARKDKRGDDIYEDEDGKATPESAARFSNRLPKIAVLLWAAFGLALQIAYSVVWGARFPGHTENLWNWLAVAAWGLNFLQALAIVVFHDPVRAYNQGIYLAVSSLALLSLHLFNFTSGGWDRADLTPFLLCGLTILGAGGLMMASITLPRRPDVFFQGQLVDRIRTDNIFRRLTFGWASNLMSTAAEKGDLEMKDLPYLDSRLRAENASLTWEANKNRFSLPVFLLRTYGWRTFAQCMIAIVNACVSYLPWWITLRLLEVLEKRAAGEPTTNAVWLLLVWLALSKLAGAILESMLFWALSYELQIPMRSQLSTIIYEKSLRRKNIAAISKKREEQNGTATPEGGADKKPKDDDKDASQKSRQAVINLVGVDADRVAMLNMVAYMVPVIILRLTISIRFLVFLLGWIPLVLGFSSVLLTMPVNFIFSKLLFTADQKLMTIRDEKLELVNEALQGIRQIKFSALESQWEKRILGLREKELRAVWEVFRTGVGFEACWTSAPILLAVTSLGTYAWRNGSITPSVAFTSIGILSTIDFAVSSMPMLIRFGIDCWVSVKRIQKYLEGPELSRISKEGSNISFDGASLAWPVDDDATEETERFVLRDVSLSFPPGQLSVISGNTGSGKSLLLAAILGEADLLSGSAYVPRPQPLDERQDSNANAGNWILPSNMAYVGQIPWIENATLRDNILFGLPYDKERYEQTLAACALNKDLESLSDGDQTELGINGVNLSGGQKWRVTVARAVYSRAGILVMDDIFSAVDANVGRQLLDGCLLGSLCEGRTRILVTHHLGLVEKHAKFLVELADGGVSYAGLTSELEEEGILERIKSHQAQEPAANGKANGVTNGEAQKTAAETRKFVEDEAREKGSVKGRVYAAYIQDSGGWLVWGFLAVLYLSNETFQLLRSWVVRLWTGEAATAANITSHAASSWHVSQSYHAQQALVPLPTPLEETKHSVEFWLMLYAGAAFVGIFFGIIKVYFTFVASYRASRYMFKKILSVVLRAPLRWTDTVPVGRILNRFTSDFDSIDNELARELSGFITIVLQALGICAASIFVSPLILPFAAVCLGWVAWLAAIYLKAARPMKRLESTAKSPVFELFGSSLAGLTTIRAFDRTTPYCQTMHTRIDNRGRCSLNLNLFSRWIGWNMGVVGIVFTITVAVFVLLKAQRDAALAGFVLTFAMQFSTTVLWTVRSYASLELEMNAVERVLEYSEIETENFSGEKPPAAWPTDGRLEVHDLVVGYARDLPPVLKGLNFHVNPSKRVGVVGRTGAGKSSLTLALFRFLEPRSGSIYVDGLDVSKIPLSDLRSRLAIIPQDPVLFSGTVRSNLDPFEDHTDDELRDALRRVHLVSEAESSATPQPTTGTNTPAPEDASTSDTATVTNPRNTNIFRDLDSPISEGGHNLSQGQRQLLCLARAIVSRPKIMVLDEATSAVDMATDALIQRSIREEFRGSTLLVIAHRLSTIADFDRILVLSDGEVVEFATPKELWDLGEKGVFRSMCQESGEAEKLKSIIVGDA
ncbi:ATP-dependent bile acid permease [Echria macrotheca]|uniref:ATP-dependent bile acid permease n=1 Tax=Echria macrotheca TaxID=438768 RepID=A0AAJ0B2P3_9PEZI|nr:ATP-dependent bile acid permease [Echria macrotheca]